MRKMRRESARSSKIILSPFRENWAWRTLRFQALAAKNSTYVNFIRQSSQEAGVSESAPTSYGKRLSMNLRSQVAAPVQASLWGTTTTNVCFNMKRSTSWGIQGQVFQLVWITKKKLKVLRKWLEEWEEFTLLASCTVLVAMHMPFHLLTGRLWYLIKDTRWILGQECTRCYHTIPIKLCQHLWMQAPSIRYPKRLDFLS